MTPLNASDLAAFARKFRFPGSKMRRVCIRNRGKDRIEVIIDLSVRTAIADLGSDPTVVRLRLRWTGVEEFRFQKRPGSRTDRLPDVKIANIQGLFYVMFDTWSLSPGERPGVHDFRGSESFVAGRSLEWEIITPGSKTS